LAIIRGYSFNIVHTSVTLMENRDKGRECVSTIVERTFITKRVKIEGKQIKQKKDYRNKIFTLSNVSITVKRAFLLNCKPSSCDVFYLILYIFFILLIIYLFFFLNMI
jgi:hypothetical protein